MSLISDALKKAELQRATPPPTRVPTWDHAAGSSTRERSSRTTSHVPSRFLLFANVVLVAAICVVAIFFFRNRAEIGGTTQQNIAATSPAPPPLTASTPEISRPAATPIAEAPPAQVRSMNLAANSQPATGDYDLGGTSALGSTTLLSVVRRSDKHSVWVPVGKTVGEITAVSYDPATDRAVIRVHGNLLSVTARDSASSAQPAE